MITPTDEPEGMRHDQTHEANRAGSGDTHTHDQRGANVKQELESRDIDTEMERTLLPDGQQIERPREQAESHESGDDPAPQ